MPWYSSELATLTITPYYPYAKHPVWKDTVTEFPDGQEQRVTYQTVPRYVHEIGLANLTDSDAANLIEFFVARQGRLEPFKWVPPGESNPIYVRFNQTSLPLTKRHYNNWLLDGRLSLIEVHSSEIIVDE